MSFYSLLILLLFPAHLTGLITNYLPYKLPVIFINKNIKDKHFHGSLKYAFGVVLFYLYWIVIFISLGLWQGWLIASLSAITFPIIAFLNLKFWISFVKIKGKWKYLKIRDSNSFNTVRKDFKEIETLVN